MVGRAALIECIESKDVEEVMLINRSSINVSHSKVKELIHEDFSDFSAIKNQLAGFDACFHCMGVSSAGMSEEKYTHITYTMTVALADTLYELNPNMVFNYVSGTGSDSTEQGKSMWGRVKGKTENYILAKGFKDAYAFRPGGILPEKGVKSKTPLYNIIYILTRPLFPIMRKMDSITGSSNVGKALINSVLMPGDLKHLENTDINKLSKH